MTETEYHVFEIVGAPHSPAPTLAPRSIHHSAESAVEAASEYENWEWDADMEIGDVMPNALIFEVERFDSADGTGPRDE